MKPVSVDATKLLGFRLAATESVANGTAVTPAALGLKQGGKPRVKFGIKAGGKPV
jgi:hypothetical protein